MVIEFSKGRLHVGYRLKNWQKAYFMPGPDNERFFQKTKKEADKKDDFVLAGEIAWLPIFNPIYVESLKKGEREMMHQKQLIELYQYLKEGKENFWKKMQEPLDDPGRGPRWAVLFKDAKAFKNRGLKSRRRRERYRRTRDPRAANTANGGASDLFVNDALDSPDESFESDTDDDGYESGARDAQEVRREASATPTPAFPNDPRIGPKKRDLTRDRPSTAPSSRWRFPRVLPVFDPSQPSYSMSGGLGLDPLDLGDEDTVQGQHMPADGSQDVDADHPLARDTTARRRGRSRTMDGGDATAEPRAKRERLASPHGPGAKELHADGSRATPVPTTEPVDEHTVRGFNGNEVTDEEAFEEAVRQSMQPETRPGGLDVEAALRTTQSDMRPGGDIEEAVPRSSQPANIPGGLEAIVAKSVQDAMRRVRKPSPGATSCPPGVSSGQPDGDQAARDGRSRTTPATTPATAWPKATVESESEGE